MRAFSWRSSRWRPVLLWTVITGAFATLGLACAVVLTTDVTVERAGADADPCRDPAYSGAGCQAFRNTCPGYTMETSDQTFEVYQNELPRAEIEGVRFPRVGRTLYRGLRESVDQFTVSRVLRAIGGDPTPTIQTRLPWLVQSVLMHPERLAAGHSLLAPFRRAYRWHIFGLPTLYDGVEEVFQEHAVLGNVEKLLSCQPSYNERDSAFYAKDVALKALRNMTAKWGARATRYLFAYNTAEFVSYGDYAGGIDLYSSLYPSIANAYGSKVLVFSNDANRSLDLNYWNFRRNNGIWSYHDADRAEFVTAVDVEPDSVLGIWKTDESQRDKADRDKAMHPRSLSYALMRLDLDGARYALILDAATTDCVMRVGAHFEGCRDRVKRQWGLHDVYDASQIDFGPLIPDGKPLPVIAAVRACPADDASCGVPDTVFAGMPASTKGLTAAEQEEISSASFRIDGRPFVQRIRFPETAAGFRGH